MCIRDRNSNTITLDGTNTTYTNFTNSSAGLVPSPGGGGNSFKFLNENGSWELPSYTTSLFYDTNNSPAGQNGLVPAPAANETTKFLRGDATWQTVSTGDTYALTAATSSNDALLTLDATSGSDSSIKFIAGTDIGLTVDAASTPKTITIASTATGYSLPLAADGTRGGIQIGATGLGAKEYAVQLSSEKAYVAVPWVNTTYSTFTYDSSTPASSTSGLVPAPTTSGDNAKFLRGDATWVTPTDTTDNAAGTAGQLQYTTGSGVFAATSDMVYTTDQLKVQNTLYLDGNGPAGGGSGNAGIVKLGCEAAGASHYVGLEGPTHAGNNSYIIKFPDATPTASQILKVNTVAGSTANMIWAADTDTSIYAADGVLAGARVVTMAGNNLTFNSTGGLFTIQKNLKVEGQSYGDITSVSNATVDWDSGNIQSITLPSGASTYTPTNPQAGATYILKIIQPSAGDGTITWGSSVKWPGATAPTLTCLLYTSPSPRDRTRSRMPSSA